MCGISGILNLDGKPLDNSDIVSYMATQLVHRGPDDEGYLEDGPVAFGFRRLSIIDVAGGHQPVHNENRSVWCIFNGEIYNFVELRDTLEGYGHIFYTKSDAETIVHAYETWGLDFVHYLRGMFAIALWDQPRQRLVLARDRIGKKPLFYSVNRGQLAFASELKGLLGWSGLDHSLDLTAVQDYLRFLYVPAPRSIFKGVRKLLPGHLLVADAEHGGYKVHSYSSFEIAPDVQQTEQSFVSGLRQRLEEAVRIRLRSDVPLGALLSGGLDSSAVVALMARQPTGSPPMTFSMGFQDMAYDETSFANIMAQHIGSNHHEEVVEPITPELLKRIVWHLDEPFADSSAIPTYLVCQAARRHVTVVLSGDGGDELFAGYNLYRRPRLIAWVARLPASQRKMMLATIEAAKKRLVNTVPGAADRLGRVARALMLSLLPISERRCSMTQYFDPQGLERLLAPDVGAALDGYRVEDELTSLLDGFKGADPIDAFLYLDTLTSLPGDILTKVDRMSMAHGLEVRCPLLDQEVVSFAGKIPANLKLRGREGKYVLKKAVSDILPAEILSRSKQGFAVPFGPWLAGTFYDVVEDCLSQESVQSRGLFQAQEVSRLRELALSLDWSNQQPESRSQRRLWRQIWPVLMLELWCREFLPHP